MSLYNLANGELKKENDKLKLEIKRKTDEIYDLKKTKNKLQKQLEAYKNMRKEANEYTKSHFKEMVADEEAQILLDILNKVGEDND